MAVSEGDEDLLQQLKENHDAVLDLLSSLVRVDQPAVPCGGLNSVS